MNIFTEFYVVNRKTTSGFLTHVAVDNALCRRKNYASFFYTYLCPLKETIFFLSGFQLPPTIEKADFDPFLMAALVSE